MEFLFLALLSGLGVAIIAAPLGAFVVWQRLAYFGDTLAHSSLMGIAFGLLLSINIQVSIIVSCSAVALLLTLWQSQRQLPTDTLLGIISHTSLAVGLILVSLFDTGRVDLTTYLLGDILATTYSDVVIIYAVVLVSSLLMWRFWDALLAITVNEALAKVEGIATQKVRLLLLFLLALVIAVAIKVVGVLLITALLIVPAASARFLSRTPEQMVVIAAMIGSTSVIAGLGSSFYWDTPAGPSIAASTGLLFIVCLLLKRI